MRGASHQSSFMDDCLTNSHTCVLPCLPGEWVSFCVLGAVEVDGAWVGAKSALRHTLLPKVYATLGKGNRF